VEGGKEGQQTAGKPTFVETGEKGDGSLWTEKPGGGGGPFQEDWEGGKGQYHHGVIKTKQVVVKGGGWERRLKGGL